MPVPLPVDRIRVREPELGLLRSALTPLVQGLGVKEDGEEKESAPPGLVPADPGTGNVVGTAAAAEEARGRGRYAWLLRARMASMACRVGVVSW